MLILNTVMGNIKEETRALGVSPCKHYTTRPQDFLPMEWRMVASFSSGMSDSSRTAMCPVICRALTSTPIKSFTFKQIDFMEARSLHHHWLINKWAQILSDTLYCKLCKYFFSSLVETTELQRCWLYEWDTFDLSSFPDRAHHTVSASIGNHNRPAFWHELSCLDLWFVASCRRPTAHTRDAPAQPGKKSARAEQMMGCFFQWVITK